MSSSSSSSSTSYSNMQNSSASASSSNRNVSYSGRAFPDQQSHNFNATMRDRQARNKDALTGLVDSGESTDMEDEDDEDDMIPAKQKSKQVSAADDRYESEQRRREAAVILDSPELLMMHAESRQDSLAGTRYHFTKILCGYEDPPDKNADKPKLTTRNRGKGNPFDLR